MRVFSVARMVLILYGSASANSFCFKRRKVLIVDMNSGSALGVPVDPLVAPAKT